MQEGGPVIVSAGVIVRDGCILVTRRKPGTHLEGLWELPGGKLERHESPEEALRRELQEELGLRVRVGRILDVVFHRYPDKDVLLLFYACEVMGGVARPIDVDALAWVPKGRIERLSFVPADADFVRRLTRNVDLNVQES